jgi:hypothetical protein
VLLRQRWSENRTTIATEPPATSTATRQDRRTNLVYNRHACAFRENMEMYNRVRVSVVYETETPPAPRTDLGPYRRADYLALPDEPRCELVYGRLLVMAAPALRHQEVVARVLRLLLDFADRTGGRAFVSPVDVALADHSIVQPDVVTSDRCAPRFSAPHGSRERRT